MSAEDLDSQGNGRITYSILKGDRNNHFWIDPVTGILKVNKRLDRELVRRHPSPQYLIKQSIVIFWFKSLAETGNTAGSRLACCDCIIQKKYLCVCTFHHFPLGVQVLSFSAGV